MKKTVKKTRRVRVSGWALVHQKYHNIVFIAVPHDALYSGTRNVIVRETKKMLLDGAGIKTVLKPCLMSYEVRL